MDRLVLRDRRVVGCKIQDIEVLRNLDRRWHNRRGNRLSLLWLYHTIDEGGTICGEIQNVDILSEFYRFWLFLNLWGLFQSRRSLQDRRWLRLCWGLLLQESGFLSYTY